MCWLEILINIGVSIVSSVIIWSWLQLYSIGAREKVNSLLIVLRDESIAFEKYLKYNDYDNALQMTRRMSDKTCKILTSIKKLTYTRKKRLLINTLLCNIYSKCYRFLYKEVGYANDLEKVACCEKMAKEIFVIGDDVDTRDIRRLFYCEPVTSVSVQILIDLNTYRFRKLAQILKGGSFFNGASLDCKKLQRYYMKLVDVDVFKNNMAHCVGRFFNITSDTLTQLQYTKIIQNMK